MRLIHRFFTGGLAFGLFLLLLSVSAPLAAQTGDGRIIVHLESTGLGNYQFDHFVEEIYPGDYFFVDTAPHAGWYLA